MMFLLKWYTCLSKEHLYPYQRDFVLEHRPWSGGKATWTIAMSLVLCQMLGIVMLFGNLQEVEWPVWFSHLGTLATIAVATCAWVALLFAFMTGGLLEPDTLSIHQLRVGETPGSIQWKWCDRMIGAYVVTWGTMALDMFFKVLNFTLLLGLFLNTWYVAFGFYLFAWAAYHYVMLSNRQKVLHWVAVLSEKGVELLRRLRHDIDMGNTEQDEGLSG